MFQKTNVLFLFAGPVDGDTFRWGCSMNDFIHAFTDTDTLVHSYLIDGSLIHSYSTDGHILSYYTDGLTDSSIFPRQTHSFVNIPQTVTLIHSSSFINKLTAPLFYTSFPVAAVSANNTRDCVNISDTQVKLIF